MFGFLDCWTFVLCWFWIFWIFRFLGFGFWTLGEVVGVVMLGPMGLRIPSCLWEGAADFYGPQALSMVFFFVATAPPWRVLDDWWSSVLAKKFDIYKT